jgi:L-fucose mutarotase
VVRLDGIAATRALDAVLGVMPLDEFVPEACWRMEVVGAPETEQPIFEEFRSIIAKREGARFKLASLDRSAFYARARECFAIVPTGERRLYGDIILKKGIVRPE